ncbi:MAG: DUF4388 domain-containing protein [Candidatus Dormibacteria bacterium]
MQSSGTLAELSLEGILDSIQKDRATGTLHLRSSDGEATLYFLFGHLFHATDPSPEQGEVVVHRALGWATGDFSFDAKAKLPAEETIKVSTAELLANRPGAASSNGAHPPDAGDDAADDTAQETTDEATDEDSAGEATPVAAEEAASEEEQPERARATKSDTSAAEGPMRRRTDQRPGTRPPETMVLYPVPLGNSLHEGLTAGFVDFPKLLRSLSKDGHSGYVRLSGEGFLGVLLFSSGAVVEAIYDAGSQVSTGNDAFDLFGDRIDDGDGSLDVIQLTPEMVTGIFQLLTAPSVYEKLLARFIKADALLEYLSEQKTSGAVIVRGANEATGIVLYREGQLLGAYTDESRAAATKADKVIALCEDPTAEIEVRGGKVPETLPVMQAAADGAPSEVPSGSRGKAAPAKPEVEAPDEPVTPPADQPEAATDEGEETAHAGDDDLSSAVNQMAARADAVLGTRAKKVKELLFAAGHDRADVDATIEKVAELSIMFVDPSKLSSLADEFRQIAAQQG